MADNTTNLALPYLMASQAQKHVTHNEALRLLDGLVQLSVRDRELTAPPGSPAEGDRYLVAIGATAEWAGWDLNIAYFVDGAWMRLVPRPGWRTWIEDEGALLFFDGTAWTGSTSSELQNLSLLGLGTTANAANPFSAKLNAALWTALTTAEGGTGDLRYTMNKEAAGNVLSLLMQTGWSARAELGLAGDDSFRIKVSPDGTSWTDAIVVAPNGDVAIAGVLTLDQDLWTYPLRIANSGGSGAAGLTLQFAAEGEYTFDVRAGQPPTIRAPDGTWLARFDRDSLSANASVMTRQLGDARYLRQGWGTDVGNVALLKNKSGAWVGKGSNVAGSSLAYVSITSTGTLVEQAAGVAGTWAALSPCGADNAAVFQRTI
jgi:hypothetical protein